MTAATPEPEWDSEDSSRHQDLAERGAAALEDMLAGDLGDARWQIGSIEDDTDLEALRKALDDLETECRDELGRRHSS